MARRSKTVQTVYAAMAGNCLCGHQVHCSGDKLSTTAIEDIVERLEARVHAACPEVVALFIKPQTPARFAQARSHRFGGSAASCHDG